MVVRATMAEIDTMRMSVEDGIDLFRESVIPALHEQPGYHGVYVLLSPEGKALVLSFWESEEHADSGLAGSRSFYSEQVEKFMTLYRAPPGRETYRVVVAEEPSIVTYDRA
jgi:heme-degrading monooxygenase HmoA